MRQSAVTTSGSLRPPAYSMQQGLAGAVVRGQSPRGQSPLVQGYRPAPAALGMQSPGQVQFQADIRRRAWL